MNNDTRTRGYRRKQTCLGVENDLNETTDRVGASFLQKRIGKRLKINNTTPQSQQTACGVVERPWRAEWTGVGCRLPIS